MNYEIENSRYDRLKPQKSSESESFQNLFKDQAELIFANVNVNNEYDPWMNPWNEDSLASTLQLLFPVHIMLNSSKVAAGFVTFPNRKGVLETGLFFDVTCPKEPNFSDAALYKNVFLESDLGEIMDGALISALYGTSPQNHVDSFTQVYPLPNQ